MLTVQRSNTGNHVTHTKVAQVVGRRGSWSVSFTSFSWFITNLGGTDSNTLNPRVTVEKLPDDVLLEIFYVARCQVDANEPRYFEDRWRTLVHVCKRWRSVVFASPRRLDLQLFCTNRTPVKKLLDIWPPLPIYIQAFHDARKWPLRIADLMARARATKSRAGNLYLRRSKFVAETICGNEAVSGADSSGSLVE